MNIHELTTSKYFFLLQLWIKPLRGRAKYLTTMRNILFSSFQDAMICKEKRLGALHLTKSPRRFSCCGFKESRPHLYPTIHLFTFKNVTQRSDIGTTFAICYRIGRGSFVNLIWKKTWWNITAAQMGSIEAILKKLWVYKLAAVDQT